jgi:PAS domain S-box-containing protein
VVIDPRAVGDRHPDPKIRALVRVAVAVTEQPWAMSRDDLSRALLDGLDEAEFLHAVLQASLFGHFNRIADAVGVELDYVDAFGAPHVEPASPPYLRPRSAPDPQALRPMELSGRPGATELAATWERYALDRDAPLSRRQRAVIASAVAECLGDATVSAAAPEDDIERALVDLADLVTLAPWKLAPSAYVPLRDLGLADDATVFDAVATASSAGVFSRIRVTLAALARQGGAATGDAVTLRAEEALRETEQRYHTLFDSIDEGFCIIEFLDGPHGPLSDYVHVEANPAYERHAGIPKVVGQKVRDMVPEEADGWVDLYRRVLVTGEPIRFERELVATGRHLELSAFRVEPASRRQVGVLFQDVTARKRAEEARKEEQRRAEAAHRLLDAVASGTEDVIATMDTDFRFTFVNDAYRRRFYEVFGTEVAAGVRLDAALAHLPDERRNAMALWEKALLGERVSVVAEFGDPARARREWNLRFYPLLDAAGAITGAALFAVDTSDRRRAEEALRQSEQRLRQMADTMAHMIWVTRPDGYHEWYNRRWYEFTGVPEGSTDGEGWNGMFHPEDQSRAWSRWKHSLDSGEAYEIEYRLRHRTGEYRWVLGRALPIRNDRGEIERWFGTCTDIHAMRQLVDEREHLLQSEQTARIEAERASRMKDEFLATLSHEIRTPLNAILGWAAVLRSTRIGAAEATEGLEVIERNARVQAQIIDDLLDMSRIVSGKLRLDVQRIDLADVIRAAAETVAPAAGAKDIHVQLVLDPLAGPISGDPHRLQQVFWNLLSNAIKFTARGGRVQVLLERVNSHVEVSVVDSGQGIDPAFLPYVFDRFRQADATTTRRHGGLGLGLAIVKQLVELHGGSIRAKSPGLGKGATFVMALPLLAVHPDVDPSQPRRHPTADTAAAGMDPWVSIAGVRVLVVDDEADARVLLKRLLQECDAIVTTVSSAAEAVAFIQAERPDVLVSDIGMPEEDGYSLIRRVRALPADQGGRIPAIALTAYARAEDRVKAVVSGFQHHLSKPVEPMELIAVVASLVDRR